MLNEFLDTHKKTFEGRMKIEKQSLITEGTVLDPAKPCWINYNYPSKPCILIKYSLSKVSIYYQFIITSVQ